MWKYFTSLVYNLIKLFLLSLYILNLNNVMVNCLMKNDTTISEEAMELHKIIVNEYYAQRKDWYTSNLGSIMYKNADRKVYIRPKRQREYLVVLRRNLIKQSTRSIYTPNINLGDCAVQNCKFTDDKKKINRADAVVVFIDMGVIPSVKNRDPRQIWILFTDKSPMHAYWGVTMGHNLKDLSDIFNWTMTYRSDSEIPVPYGRTVHLPEPIVDLPNTQTALNQLVPYWNKKQSTILVTTIISRCDIPHQLLFLNQLQKLMMVDVEGFCFAGKKPMKCQHTFFNDLQTDCPNSETFLFYLVFETASCRQYLTEKIFHYAYSKGAIPIIMGPPLADCKKLLPPNSFLHMENYQKPSELVNHLYEIAKDAPTLLAFHTWRQHFAVLNEHGYFNNTSPHFCRVCEALNYNDGEEKIYGMDDLKLFFEEKLLCDVNYNGTNYPVCPITKD